MLRSRFISDSGRRPSTRARFPRLTISGITASLRSLPSTCLCMSLFAWAKFRSTKSGIKIHTQVDIITEIPVFYRITNANVHDVNAMDWLTYEPLACYVFDRGYFDLARLYQITMLGAFFIIREKKRPEYEIIAGEDVLDGEDNVLRDQTIVFTKKQNKEKYPGKIRRIVYYAPDLHRTFTYYTNNFYLTAKDIALLYKYRWQVELFFKWIKQHLKVKSFWGESDNAVRIQIHVAIITYCLIGIIEHDLKLRRPIMQVSWAAPFSPRMTLWSFSPRLRTRKNQMVSSLKLNLYTINIY